jgi:predicted thioredoxin/glutaredoxin
VISRRRIGSFHFNPEGASMDIKVLGTCCCATGKNTVALMEQIERIAKAKGVSVTLSRVDELRDIMGYGVMSMPGVVIDGKVVHAGGVPGRDQIEQWLSA